VREGILRQHLEWFDGPPDRLEAAVAEIAALDDLPGRVEAASARREASAAIYYAELLRRLQARAPLGAEDLLPPDADALLRHYRLVPGDGSTDDFGATLAASAEALIREEGVLAALERLTGLPVPLPVPLVEAVVGLPVDEWRRLTNRLLRLPESPLSRFHLAHLLLRSGDERPAGARLARRVIRSLVSETGTADIAAFLAVLDWANEATGRWRDTQGWAPATSLAIVWCHAHRLYVSFRAAKVSPAGIQSLFSRLETRLPAELFDRRLDRWLDVAHPRWVNGEGFLLASIAYALSSQSELLAEDERRRLEATLLTDQASGRLPL
jgi:hypothetical protein